MTLCSSASPWCRKAAGCFPSLTVEENLLLGGYSERPGPWTLKRVYELFPRLHDLRHLPAPALSGGQQQMAAIGRGADVQSAIVAVR